MYWGNGMGGWGMLLMTASTLLFWGLVAAGIVALIGYVRGGQAGALTGPLIGQRGTPQQVLAERFARGEIDEEEYARRLSVLGGAAGR